MVTRRGFGLVEVVVAALLLGGGLLTLAAAAVAARSRLAATAADESALRVAATLLDSLRAARAPVSDSTRRDGVDVRWDVVADRIRLVVRYRAGIKGERERAFEIQSMDALPSRPTP